MRRHAPLLLILLLDVLLVGSAVAVLLVLSLDRIDAAAFGWRIRVGGVGRPLVVLLVSLALRLGAARRVDAWDRTRPLAPHIARLGFVALLIAWTLTVVHFGVRVCGGLDSYGYVGAAALFASGAVSEPQPVAAWLPFPEAARAAAPLGFVVGADGQSRVPRFPPGLPLIMAVSRVFGPNGPFWVPLLAALATLAVIFAMGCRHRDALSGLFAASVVAMSPTLVNGAIQPMSDVPATLWLVLAAGCALGPLNAPALAGVATGMAVLTRPALLPAALAVIALAWWRTMVSVGPHGNRDARPRPSWRGLLALTALFTVIVLAQAALNHRLYGSATSSGYGLTTDLLHPSRIRTNAFAYAAWITRSHTPLFWGGWLLGLAVLRSRGWPIRHSAVAAAVAVPYLLYFTWDDWESTRFVLPGIVLVLALSAEAIDGLVSNLLPRGRPLLLLLVAATLAAASHGYLARHGVFELWRAEAKYPMVGAWFRDHTSSDAIVIAALHSGSLRYYAGRETVRWDEIPERWLTRTVTSLVSHARVVYLALDAPSENERFRQRFSEDLTGLELIPRASPANAHIYELRPRRIVPMPGG
jgi:hypothetical protein